MSVKCNAVFEGGGVKAIALAGAVSVLEEHGYEFVNLAGTSAGAIVAALLAAGYNSQEIKGILLETDFTKFRDETLLAKFGILGKTLKVLLKYGVYSSDYFESWLNGLLYKKGRLRFGDLRRNGKCGCCFQAIASDLSGHRMLVLPRDLGDFTANAESFSIARAVRMSMSIPVYYEPVYLNGHIIVDGGLLSNYPLWLFDDEGGCGLPTIGMKLSGDSVGEGGGSEIENLVDYAKALVTTALDAHDNYYVSTKTGDKQRTIFISTTVNINGVKKVIKTTDFNISRNESLALFENGASAARSFLAEWNHNEWARRFGRKW